MEAFKTVENYENELNSACITRLITCHVFPLSPTYPLDLP